jgi:DHA2 family multidrug resistance protein-like MFS transporter
VIWAGATDAAIARSTIGGAVASAAKLHNAALLQTAREAFVNSLHITAGICAVIILVIAVLVAVKFKDQARPVV